MAIGTYAQLTTAITSGWPHRADLSGQSDNFIALAEAKFNRLLRTRQQETALSETAIDASYQVAIPSNTVAVKRLWRTDSPVTPLMPATLDFVLQSQGETQLGTSGLALNYAWEATKWRFDGTGNVAGVLYRNVPGLNGTDTTNWLLTSHPDLYLYACLAEVALYLENEQRYMRYAAMTESLIARLNRTEKRDEFSGPLMVRAR